MDGGVGRYTRVSVRSCATQGGRSFTTVETGKHGRDAEILPGGMAEMKATYTARIASGRIHAADHLGYAAHLEAYEGKQVRITIEPATRKRSTPQNAYYWAVVVPMVRDGIGQATGDIYTPEEVHEFLKGKFNAVPMVNHATGEVDHIARSTASLKVGQFMDYLAMIRRWAVDFLGITIPEPNEQVEFELH